VSSHRRHFLDKSLYYLFSLDGNLEYGREDIGFVSGGVRINAHSVPRDSRAYSVVGETRVFGEKLVAGTMVWGGDWALAREDDIELLDVKALIRTDDNAVVEVEYGGVLAAGPRSFRQVISEKPKFGSEQNPLDATFYVAPRFNSGDPRYAWLNGRQCLGFGRVKFIESLAKQATVDFWMMD